MSFQKDKHQFNSLLVHNELQLRPAGGVHYVLNFQNVKECEDWRADGWLWRQQRTQKYTGQDKSVGVKYYFDSRIGHNDESSKEFQKRAFTNSNHPQKIILQYIGEEKVAVAVPHGNATGEESKTIGHVQTKPSLRNEMKDRHKEVPQKVYEDLSNRSTKVTEQIIHTPRNTKQVTNLQEAGRRHHKISQDFIYNIVEIAFETDFIYDFVLLRHFVVSCLYKGTSRLYIKSI